MNKLKMSFFCTVLFLYSSATMASGNGNGTEPPDEDKKADQATQLKNDNAVEKQNPSQFCDIFVLICVMTTNSGNGNGTEPPIT